MVSRAYYTNLAKDASRPEHEKHLPPPVMYTGSTSIEIKSRAVIHALRTVIGYYPDFSATGDVIRISEPFEPLYHYRQELQEYRDQFVRGSGAAEECKEDSNVADDIGILLRVFDDLCGQSIKNELSRHQLPKPTCTHDMLWMLFKPGEDYYFDYHHDNKTFDARIISKVKFTYTEKRASEYEIYHWGMDCNFGYVGPCKNEVETIRPFAGEKEIADLTIFPCKFLREDKHGTTHEKHYQRLTKRGEMWYALLQGPQFATFDGQTATWPPKSYRGRAMVDMHHYSIQNEPIELAKDVEVSHIVTPRCHCSRCSVMSKHWLQARTTFAGYSQIEPEKTKHLGEHQRFLCPFSIDAYLLKHRAWSMSTFTIHE